MFPNANPTLTSSRLTSAYYRDDQQVKFMDLQAEVDSLLAQLQDLKSERVETPNEEE